MTYDSDIAVVSYPATSRVCSILETSRVIFCLSAPVIWEGGGTSPSPPGLLPKKLVLVVLVPLSVPLKDKDRDANGHSGGGERTDDAGVDGIDCEKCRSMRDHIDRRQIPSSTNRAVAPL